MDSGEGDVPRLCGHGWCVNRVALVCLRGGGEAVKMTPVNVPTCDSVRGREGCPLGCVRRGALCWGCVWLWLGRALK